MRRILAALVGVAIAGVGLAESPSFPKTKAEVIALREDVWAEAAIRQPGGPSYEFYRDLFPPLRYVDADFRHYPIALSAPGSAVKGRLVSNGSAINALARQPNWATENGTPVHVRLGAGLEAFGGDLDRLDGPRYVDGWLPIVRLAYDRAGEKYGEEIFAAVDEPLASAGAVVAKFEIPAGDRGRLTLWFEHGYDMLTGRGGQIKDKAGNIYAAFDDNWEFLGARNLLVSKADHAGDGHVTIFTKPVTSAPAAGAAFHAKQRDLCERRWRDLLRRGVNLEVPEPVVQNAWRSQVVGNEMIAVGDRMHYSANNSYSHLYEGECGDTTRALMLYGQTADARRFVGPLLDFPRQDTRFHVAGHKLQLLAHYYLVTRDREYMKDKEPVWNRIIDLIVNNRQRSNGLVLPDRYAGDINRPVLSLSSNSACWRGLRDMAVVLHDLGDRERAEKLEAECKEYKAAILAAVARSERHETDPPFLPIPLMADEKPVDPITSTQLGSYWDLMAPYVLGSDIFAGTERETWIIDYLRHHGGLAMGMIRSHSHQGQFLGEPGNNVLYGLRYMQTIIRRDDVPHALAGFYGQLAQGMTRETFIGGEGSKFFHGDDRGRSFYLPPNSTANAMFLQTLRYLLVQDWPDEAGKPHELRLLYGVPGRWLEDGKSLKFERAPTLFGPVSFRCESRLSNGEVVVEADAPPRPPAKWTLRPPLPPGWRFTSATVGDQPATMGDGGVVDLTGKTGTVRVRYAVEKQ